MKVHVNLKRKRSDCDSEDSTDLFEKKKKEINICEIKLWKALRLNIDKLNTVKGTERETLLKEIIELRETIKFLYNDVHAEIRHAEPDKSITITLKFVSAYHLKAFMTNLNTLEQCLKADLKLLQSCQEYDLTDTVIQLTIAEELYNECEMNLKESKYESNRLLQSTSCQVLVLQQNKTMYARKSQQADGGRTQILTCLRIVQ